MGHQTYCCQPETAPKKKVQKKEHHVPEREIGVRLPKVWPCATGCGERAELEAIVLEFGSRLKNEDHHRDRVPRPSSVLQEVDVPLEPMPSKVKDVGRKMVVVPIFG